MMLDFSPKVVAFLSQPGTGNRRVPGHFGARGLSGRFHLLAHFRVTPIAGARSYRFSKNRSRR
jgi:hypothetical protein